MIDASLAKQKQCADDKKKLKGNIAEATNHKKHREGEISVLQKNIGVLEVKIEENLLSKTEAVDENMKLSADRTAESEEYLKNQEEAVLAGEIVGKMLKY